MSGLLQPCLVPKPHNHWGPILGLSKPNLSEDHQDHSPTMGVGYLNRFQERLRTLLQPHLGDSRHQELRNSPFWPTPLFKSQLVKDGEDFLLEKGIPKDSQGFGPYQNKPFRGPHHKKKGSYRKRPYGAIPLKTVTIVFLRQGVTKLQRLQGSFSTPQQGMRVWKPLLPMTPFKPPSVHQ